MATTISETKNYNECMKYVADLEHFYIGAKLSQQKSDRIQSVLQRFCRERTYNTDSNVASCSSVNSLGDNTLNKITKSPVDPSLVNPFPLMVFSSRF
jgi:hypothetical protein